MMVVLHCIINSLIIGKIWLSFFKSFENFFDLDSDLKFLPWALYVSRSLDNGELTFCLDYGLLSNRRHHVIEPSLIMV